MYNTNSSMVTQDDTLEC